MLHGTIDFVANGPDVVEKLHEIRPTAAFPTGHLFAIMAPLFIGTIASPTRREYPHRAIAGTTPAASSTPGKRERIGRKAQEST
ncbi:hypothetical protein [Halomonas heilongjiangensis]|uniref:hypothetical protein n=1 Tax=Halomonas heilongjiangensis TaxID=1387883 RepID=UPI0011AF9B56|nr:hypothetical protein [Halomonas heilongjiangensis]